MKQVPNYINYKIDTSGLVINIVRSSPLKFWVTRQGYHQVHLYEKGVKKAFSIHRLVAMTYLPEYSEALQVNHTNGIKTDNRIENLEMVTHMENAVHAKENGLLNPAKGETHCCAKLTSVQVLEIREKYIPIKYSCYKLAREYGVSQQTVSDIVRNKIWKHI